MKEQFIMGSWSEGVYNLIGMSRLAYMQWLERNIKWSECRAASWGAGGKSRRKPGRGETAGGLDGGCSRSNGTQAQPKGCQWTEMNKDAFPWMGAGRIVYQPHTILRHHFPYGTWFLEGWIRSKNTLFLWLRLTWYYYLARLNQVHYNLIYERKIWVYNKYSQYHLLNECQCVPLPISLGFKGCLWDHLFNYMWLLCECLFCNEAFIFLQSCPGANGGGGGVGLGHFSTLVGNFFSIGLVCVPVLSKGHHCGTTCQKRFNFQTYSLQF